MAHKLIRKSKISSILDIESSYAVFDEFVFYYLEALKEKDNLKIELDVDLITLEEYILIVRFYIGENSKFMPPSEIKTAKDLQEWFDALNLLEKAKKNSIN